MVLVLMGATLISGLLGEYLDAITILAIIVLNGILGFIQEFRAERSLRALKELSAPTAKVVRDGADRCRPRELVPGDMVLLKSGDRVPADVRFIEANSLYAEESALTGESCRWKSAAADASEDDVPLGDQKNIGFMGTMVTRGTGRGIVVRTGMRHGNGQDRPFDPEDRRSGDAAAAAAGAARQNSDRRCHRADHPGRLAGIMHGQPVYGMFLAGVSLAVAAIPEGLPAIVTIALALGVQRMIKRKAIVRKLPSVETLGCASVICSDKTGTLTQNKMTVTRLWHGRPDARSDREGYEPAGDIAGRRGSRRCEGRPALAAAAANRGAVQQCALMHVESRRRRSRRNARAAEGSAATEPVWTIQGDPTEGALVVLGAKAGMTGSRFEAILCAGEGISVRFGAQADVRAGRATRAAGSSARRARPTC